MGDARETAVRALFNIDKGQWNENKLFEMIDEAGLDRRDAGLCTAICEGVLQHRMLIDSHIETYSSQKLNKISPYVLNILRSAVYQIEFMDRIPVSAAVNTAVNLARRSSNQRASGFVNAVLHRIAENYKNIPLPQDRIESLSVKYSHPKWLVEELEALVGADNIEKQLASDNEPADICLRVNTLKAEREQVIEILRNEGINVRPHQFLENALYVSGCGNPARLVGFKDGLYTVQDAASQICVEALAPVENADILDICAAPGGKSFAIAAKVGNNANITCCDINEKRLAKIENESVRLGVKCLTNKCSDGTVLREDFIAKFDFALADVPCSGTGDIRRKPEIRYKSKDMIERLPSVQLKILKNTAQYIKKGGTLVYSTCSVLPMENSEIIEKFLSENSEFELVPFKIGTVDATEGFATLLPYLHGTDGFFIAKLRKRI